MSEPFDNDIVRAFHTLYRDQTETHGPPWVTWRGVNCLKCPMDLWMYQQVIQEVRPRFIIEGGTASGGTSLFLADMLDLMQIDGVVISIDLDADSNRPKHHKLIYLTAETLSEQTVSVVRMHDPGGPRMLILDDGHDHEHVERELHLYTPILQKGDALVVEDTNLGGPLWGLDRFLNTPLGSRFTREPNWERFLMTFNPKGYLRCVA